MRGKPFFLQRWTMIIEEDRSVSSSRCVIYTLRREDLLVERVDSMRLMSEGMLVGLWTQARSRSSSEELEEMDLGRQLPAVEKPRVGLWMTMTVGVVRKVVKIAIRTSIVKASSLRTYSPKIN